MRTCLLTIAFCLHACGGDGSAGSGTDATSGTTATGTSGTNSGTGTDSVTVGTTTSATTGSSTSATTGDTCVPGGDVCVDTDTRASATCVDGELVWEQEDCAAGSGCIAGACVVGQCSDDCILGPDCGVWDMGSSQFVDPDPDASGLDRERAYRMWLHRDGMPHGGVGNARYTDPPQYTQVELWRGLGDSSIWTGTYLAGEAWRLQKTGSSQARANVRSLVERLHDWWNVSGSPGVLARYAVRTADNTNQAQLQDMADCNEQRVHCGVMYGGESWDYLGHISRDQYQGIMLGFAAAYEALGPGDEDVRQLIREDVVEFVEELMRERTKVPVKITIDGIPFEIDADMRFTVLHPGEYIDGKISLDVDTSGDGEMWGFQEFMPNAGDLISQVPGFGFLTNIPRAGSAVMLSSFFRVAMLVTKDVPGYEAQYETFRTYYYESAGEGGNVNDWLTTASTWSYNGSCGVSYFAINIVFEPAFNLLRLEDDAALLTSWRDLVLEAKLWGEVQGTKNSWFSFMRSANLPAADDADVTEAVAQLLQFPSPPRVREGVDLLADPQYMPHEAGCAEQTDHGNAVDVGERVVCDFIWQRHPWEIYDDGDVAMTYPGVDYLAAYWLGRAQDYIADEPGTCLREK